MDNPTKPDYRTGYTEPPHGREPVVKYKPVKSPACPRTTGKKREPCEGTGVLLVIQTGSRLPSPNSVQAVHEYDPEARAVKASDQPVPAFEPFEPLADRWFWYRCDTCGHRFSVRGEPVAPKAKKATKK